MTTLFAILFYTAFAVLLAGLGFKIAQFARTPAPLKIPTTPGPITTPGIAFRLGREAVLFESLFKSNKPLWIFAIIFHFGLFVVLARHLRYFQEPVWFWVGLVQPFGLYAGLAMVAGLGLLLLRRFVIDRVVYVTSPSDILMLLLLLGIGITGLGMTTLAHTDIIAVKAFFLGLMRFSIQPLPTDPALLVHLALVAVLMIVFPFSKLLHAPGLFFSPTRNQKDDPRERRHLSDWAAKLEAGRN
ncbi:respiratory nitrate reductase subunit gamma [Magnetospirillum moscoviense]|uniref:Nitrate reductase n=1 Tax=Magnetospirillum moscoviense TaxID=1437059 RepID=A0A178M6T6_9PROT|nr:respiratory nitrate reductase subunit gamma [Magnetospirillum moscoviense]MBF0324204.1 respiratory nitrate reductase subunit gamma [Alphaproteobacteria bacterium]OAN43755.1 nitrate reductase [Magnetospirillum moscoviense]